MTGQVEPDYSNATIAVLELQGDFAEHTSMLKSCGVKKVIGIRQLSDLTDSLDEIDGLVLPGGESTTMSKLLVEQNMLDEIRRLGKEKNLPIFGTCAGCILLANNIKQRPSQPRIGLLNVTVDRNAYGSQINSFETHLKFNNDDKNPLRIVHIRAPIIAKIESDEIETLIQYKDLPILVKQNNLLGCTFHPELTNDNRIHKLFLDIVLNYKN